ncbi:MAG: hypothetical protein GC154_09700 [bacterium]|nr:hypothetical protein [bacterium]
MNQQYYPPDNTPPTGPYFDPNDPQGRAYSRTFVVRSEGSILFPLITLGFYVLFFPIGVILNIVGLFTGPHRGCFFAMIVFLLFPAFLLFMFIMSVMGFGMIGSFLFPFH